MGPQSINHCLLSASITRSAEVFCVQEKALPQPSTSIFIYPRQNFFAA
ncbi:hypothetical protein [Klebsiella pneumoniae ISC21]|nr:hypothetical protein [Klebsiella pneumoniae ISC21]